MKKALMLMLLVVLAGGSGYWWQQQSATALQGLQVSPPTILSPMVLMDYESNSLPVDFLQRQWTYIVFADNQCQDVCLEQLKLIQASAKSAAQPLQQLLVMGYEPEAEFVKNLHQDFPALQVAVLTRSIWSIFTSQFIPVMEQLSGQVIVLVGPPGMIRLAYDELVTVEQLKHDLVLILSEAQR